jgi:hypothetical protein
MLIPAGNDPGRAKEHKKDMCSALNAFSLPRAAAGGAWEGKSVLKEWTPPKSYRPFERRLV